MIDTGIWRNIGERLRALHHPSRPRKLDERGFFARAFC
jgi:hypothetical protein